MCKKILQKVELNNNPQKRQFYRWVHKFPATGSIKNVYKKAVNPRSGRMLTRCPNNVDGVRDSVGRSPKKSLRKCSKELGLSPVSLQRRMIKFTLRRCLWCNGYRRRKWTRRHEFKSWTRLIAFHIALIPLGKV